MLGRLFATITIAAALCLLAACALQAPTPANAEAPAARTTAIAINDAIRDFPGEVGVAVLPEGGGPILAGAARPLPQHSVFKTWLAIAVLDGVDRGALRLTDTIPVTQADLGFPYQPLAARVGPEGYDATLAELLEAMVLLSDNPSADLLIRHLGGLEPVREILAAKGLEPLAPDANERALHARLDALRQGLTAAPGERQSLFDAYYAAPPNAAAPREAAQALLRLANGELLSPASTALLLGWMETTPTGEKRLKAGLAPGWRLAHKTGSGGQAEGVDMGTNDAGLLFGPAGQRIAVAVLVTRSEAPPAEAEALIAKVARIVTTAPPGAR